MATGSRLTGYIVNVMRSPVIERLIVRGSRVSLMHVFHDMDKMDTCDEIGSGAFKRWVPCGDIDRRLINPHSVKVEGGFWTTPEECLCDSGLIGIQYTAS